MCCCTRDGPKHALGVRTHGAQRPHRAQRAGAVCQWPARRRRCHGWREGCPGGGDAGGAGRRVRQRALAVAERPRAVAAAASAPQVQRIPGRVARPALAGGGGGGVTAVIEGAGRRGVDARARGLERSFLACGRRRRDRGGAAAPTQPPAPLARRRRRRRAVGGSWQRR